MSHQKSVFVPVTQRFKLDSKTVEELRAKKPNFGFNGLGELVFRRTYSRGDEDWCDVVIRVIEGCISLRKEHYHRNSLVWSDEDMQSFARDMAISMFDMEWLPPGRGLWMMGTDFVYERGAMALYNCAAVDTKKDFVLAAEWTMDCLMNGVGVGFSTTWQGTAIRPDKKDSETFVISDSREGWVESLIKLLCSYIESPKYGKNKYPIFDYSQVRAAGLPIKGFGGQSSGPEPLKKMHNRIEEYLDNFCDGYINCEKKDEAKTNVVEKKYSHTRLIADVFNAIGACVVAGNVRRSAQICCGNPNDHTFMNLKNYTENPERMEIGWMSNNSVVLSSDVDFHDFTMIPEMAQRIVDNGEPGLINLHNIQKFGRFGKTMRDEASLVNPCGEIPLENTETCNLSEVFPTRCKSTENFFHALKYATFYCSTVSLIPTHRPETNAVIAKNRRIGVGIGGIAQWIGMKSNSCWGDMNYTRLTSYLRTGYKIVRETNKFLAQDAGVPESVRVTTIKPSGSISLLVGCTPGVHYPVSRYAIRRVRIGMDSPVTQALINSGVPHEKDIYSDNTWVFEFMIDHGDIRPCEQVSPWEQLSLVATLQRCWADNCVSATIYFDKVKDSLDVEKMLAMYIPVLKSISMLPHSGHGYAQAPYEPVSEQTYHERIKNLTLPNFSAVKDNIPEGSKYCTNDTCDYIPRKKRATNTLS